MKKTILTLILCIASNFLQADPVSSNPIGVLNMILEHEKECIRAYEEGETTKIYLCSDKVVITDHGIFLALNNEFIPLPLLQSNQNGCFLETDLSCHAGCSRPSTQGPCGNCSVNTNSNGVCVNSACDFHGLRVR